VGSRASMVQGLEAMYGAKLARGWDSGGIVDMGVWRGHHLGW